MHTTNTLQRYVAFLSYSHDDNKEPGRQWATWLHDFLEDYKVPPDLVNTQNERGEPIPARLYPVFLDEEEVLPGNDLSGKIRSALENSGLLVVLCSRAAKKSRFIAEEIRYFKEIGKADRILALMIDGEPNTTDDPEKWDKGLPPDLECLPETLRFGIARADSTIDWSAPTGLIADDVRPDGRPVQGWTTGAAYRKQLVHEKRGASREVEFAVQKYERRLKLATLKVVASALAVPLEKLTKRDEARQRELAMMRLRRNRRLALAFAILALLAVIGGLVAWHQRGVARTNETAARKAEKEERAQRHRASMMDYAAALKRVENEGQWHEGLAYLARSLDWDRDNTEAAILLYSTLSLIAPENYPRLVIPCEEFVSNAHFSPDGKRILTIHSDRTTRVWDSATGKPLGKPMRHETQVWCAQFSPDGARIVTGYGDLSSFPPGKDCGAQVWDTATGEPLGKPLRCGGYVAVARFSPDGTRIVTGAEDGTAQVWTVPSGEPVGEPMRHPLHLLLGTVNDAQFSPDGTRIVTASENKTAVLWDAATGRAVGELMSHDSTVYSAEFSPEGTYVVTASEDKTARVWDATTGKPISEPLRHEGRVFQAHFSPDGLRVVTASEDKSARIWYAPTSQPLGKPLLHDSSVLDAKFSPDGIRIVTVGADDTARVWKVASAWNAASTTEALSRPLRHGSNVEFNEDGTLLLTSGGDKSARVWDAATGKVSGLPLHHSGRVLCAGFNPDGTRVVTASADNTARVWDTVTGKQLYEALSHNASVIDAQFSHDGKRIVTASQDNTARIWDAGTGVPQGEPLRHDSGVFSVSFSRDDGRILTASWDKTARVWDVPTGKEVCEPLRHDESLASAQFDPSGKRVVTATKRTLTSPMFGSHFGALIWDTGTGKKLGPELHGGSLENAEFAPDGTRIVTASDDKTARVWDATTRQALGDALHHNSSVTGAHFSPDGRWIVTASTDNTACVWAVGTGKAVGSPMQHRGSVVSVQFSSDGQRVVTASTDETAQVWDSASGKPLGGVMRLSAPMESALISPNGGQIVTVNGSAWLWDAPPPSHEIVPVPEWVRDFARAIGGLEFGATGELRPMQAPRVSAILGQMPVGSDRWAELARWLAQKAAHRAVTPRSGVTSHQLAKNERDRVGIGACEIALAHDPTLPLAHILLGEQMLRNYTNGKKSMRSPSFPPHAALLRKYGLRLLPADAALWARAAESFVEQEDYPLALQAVDRVLSLDATNVPSLRARAFAYAGLKLNDEAIVAWRAVLDTGGAVEKDFTAPALFASKLGNKADTEFFLNSGRAKFPNSAEFAKLEGWSCLNLGDHTGGLAALRRWELLLKTEKNSEPELLIIGLALALWENHQTDEAVSSYRRLIEVNSDQRMSMNWADPKSISAFDWPETVAKPLEALRAETLRRHPDLSAIRGAPEERDKHTPSAGTTVAEVPPPRISGPFDVTVIEVIPEGQGPLLGFRVGDIVRRYDGQEVTTVEQLVKLTGESKITVLVELQRGRDTLKITANSGRLGIKAENRPTLESLRSEIKNRKNDVINELREFEKQLKDEMESKDQKK